MNSKNFKNLNKKYYCLDHNKWVSEYMTSDDEIIYKLSIFGEEDVWVKDAPKKPMYGPVKTKIHLTKKEATDMFGSRVNWPISPYDYPKRSKRKKK